MSNWWRCLIEGHDVRMAPLILMGTCKRCGRCVA